MDIFSDWHFNLGGGGRLSSSAVVMLAVLAAGIVIAHFTRFGANVYAIGGDQPSARLMGVPIRRTTVMIYALAGFYSALGGVIYALYTGSGYPLAGLGDELIAIAAVVLGGTLLTGGVGLVLRHFVRRPDPGAHHHARQLPGHADELVGHYFCRRCCCSFSSSPSARS